MAFCAEQREEAYCKEQIKWSKQQGCTSSLIADAKVTQKTIKRAQTTRIRHERHRNLFTEDDDSKISFVENVHNHFTASCAENQWRDNHVIQPDPLAIRIQTTSEGGLMQFAFNSNSLNAHFVWTQLIRINVNLMHIIFAVWTGLIRSHAVPEIPRKDSRAIYIIGRDFLL